MTKDTGSRIGIPIACTLSAADAQARALPGGRLVRYSWLFPTCSNNDNGASHHHSAKQGPFSYLEPSVVRFVGLVRQPHARTRELAARRLTR